MAKKSRLDPRPSPAQNTASICRKENAFQNGKANELASKLSQNQQGFAVISYLMFVPLLLAAFASLFSFWKIQSEILKPLQICRQDNLDLQKKSLEQMNQLLKLNPLVQALRLRYWAAQTTLAAAVASQNPALIAKALLDLKQIETSQKLLKQQQVLILKKEEFQSFIDQQKIRLELSALNKNSNSFFLVQLTGIENPRRQLAVRADLDSDKPAIYETPSSFSEQQSSQTFWNLRIRTQDTSWLARTLPFAFTKRGICGASLFQSKAGWEPGLWHASKADKFFSNPHLF